MLADWPRPEGKLMDRKAEERMRGLIAVAEEARRIKHDAGLSSTEVYRLTVVPESGTLDWGADAGYVESLAAVKVAAGEPEKPFLPSAVPGFKLYLQLPGAGDATRAKTRLAKEREELEKLVAKRRAKLANGTYVARAPAEVVEEDRKRLAEDEVREKHLKEMLKAL